MAKRRHTPEQVINKLREAEVAIAEGITPAEPPTRRPRINILFGRYLILVMLLFSCAGLFDFIANTIAL